MNLSFFNGKLSVSQVFREVTFKNRIDEHFKQVGYVFIGNLCIFSELYLYIFFELSVYSLANSSVKCMARYFNLLPMPIT